MDYILNIVSKCRFFFIFKHSRAPKRSWKIFHGGPGKSWIFLSVKEWEPCPKLLGETFGAPGLTWSKQENRPVKQKQKLMSSISPSVNGLLIVDKSRLRTSLRTTRRCEGCKADETVDGFGSGRQSRFNELWWGQCRGCDGLQVTCRHLTTTTSEKRVTALMPVLLASAAFTEKNFS